MGSRLLHLGQITGREGLAYLGEVCFLTQIWPVIVFPLILLYLNRIVIPLEEK